MPRYIELFPKILFRSPNIRPFRALVIGNCQARHQANLLEIALADCACDYLVSYEITTAAHHASVETYLDEARGSYDLVLSIELGANWQSIGRPALVARFGADRTFFLLNIYFGGLFPDESTLGDVGNRIQSPMGGAHSKIVLGGWMAGLPLPEIMKLFTVENFEKLGYLEMLASSEQDLRRREQTCDTEFTEQLVNAARTSFAFYTVKHPTPNLFALFINHIRGQLAARGQARASRIPLNAMLASESLISFGVWPIYPELRDILAPHYPVSTKFITPHGATGSEVLTREAFAERSIAMYERAGRERIAPLRQASDALELVRRITVETGRADRKSEVAPQQPSDGESKTRFVCTGWVNQSAAEFEAGAALRVHAKAGRATPRNPMHVYILEGYDMLDAPYIEYLRSANIYLYDASVVTAEVLKQYQALNDITDRYDVLCFIRWFVVERLCPAERLIHFDLDLFFRPNFDEVSDILSECEGTFGSPCMTIVTPKWLRVYREAVERLMTDRAALENELEYGGNWHRRNIASDQDLTQALERKRILPQRRQNVGGWAIFSNPLWAPHNVGRPTTYASDDDFGGKPVLYWHLQNNFSEYVTRYALLKIFPHPSQKPDTHVKLALPDFSLAQSAENLAFRLLKLRAREELQRRWSQETAMTLPHSGNQFDLMYTRAWIANAFVSEGRFREIFASEWWWDDEAFVAPRDTAAEGLLVPPVAPMPSASQALPPPPLPPAPETAPAQMEGLPNNVVIYGAIEGNFVLVEPSDHHIGLTIMLRGTGNTVIVRRDCGLQAELIATDGTLVEIGEGTRMHGTRVTADQGSRYVVGARCRFLEGSLIGAPNIRGAGAPVVTIDIGDDVQIGQSVEIAKGCVIGSGAVVEAGSRLEGDYPGNSVIAGAPAKVIRIGIVPRP